MRPAMSTEMTTTETASAERPATPAITRAAERFLEQYGDPLVMNTYLKVTILVLTAVCLALAALTYKSQNALANMHPMIVRINDVGHAEAIDYRNFQYRPQEAENKYYLTRWAELYFSRNRFTIERDQTQSLYFLNSGGPGRWSGQSGKELVLAEPFLHPERERTGNGSKPFWQWCVVTTPINSVAPSSMRRAVVNSWGNPTDSVWKSIFDCAAWPLPAAQKASNQ